MRLRDMVEESSLYFVCVGIWRLRDMAEEIDRQTDRSKKWAAVFNLKQLGLFYKGPFLQATPQARLGL